MRPARALLLLAVSVLALLPSALDKESVLATHLVSLTKIAFQGESISLPGSPLGRPPVTRSMLAFGAPGVNEAGLAVFTATTSGAAPIPCFVAGGDGSAAPAPLVIDGDEAPPGPYGAAKPLALCDPAGTLLPVVAARPPLVNGGGEVLLTARVTNAFGAGVHRFGIFEKAGATLALVALEGEATPIGGIYGVPQAYDYNDGGSVLFQAAVTGGPTTSALFADPDGPGASPAVKIAAVGDAMPGTGGTLATLDLASMNDDGAVAFSGTVSGGGGGAGSGGAVWLDPDGAGATAAGKILASGDTWYSGPPAGTITYSALSQPRLLDLQPTQTRPPVMFRATADAPYGDGYFIAPGAEPANPSPSPEKLALVADPTPAGGTWTSLSGGIAPGPDYGLNEGQAVLLGTVPGPDQMLITQPGGEVLVRLGDASPAGGTFTSLDAHAVSRDSFVSVGGKSGGPAGPCVATTCGGIYTGNTGKGGGNGGSLVAADSDKDGISNASELAATCGIDTNGVAGIDFSFNIDGNPGCDVDPDIPDVFVEVDYMSCTVTSGSADANDPKDLDHDPANGPADLAEPDHIPDDDLPSDCAEDGVTTCNDGIDQAGGDALVDAADSDCTNHHTGAYDATMNLEDGVQACNDGLDQAGGDALIDGADPDCHNHKPLGGFIEGGALGIYSCEDEIDNDIPPDGLIDLADPDCSVVKAFKDGANLNATDNEDAISTCADGVNNDPAQDINIDAADGDCHTDGNPLNPTYDASRNEGFKRGTCNDGLDNFNDKKLDILDPDCSGINLHVFVSEAVAHADYLDFSSEHCDNGNDDDNNGKIDSGIDIAPPGAGPEDIPADPSCPAGQACTTGQVGYEPGNHSFELAKAVHFNSPQKIFHYAIASHMADAGDNVSGCGELPGNDFYIALGSPAWDHLTAIEYESVFMHELGHNLNLCHGGPAKLAAPDSQCDINHKPNYLSVMNYTFSFPWLTGRPLDFSRWALPPREDGSVAGNNGLGTCDDGVDNGGGDGADNKDNGDCRLVETALAEAAGIDGGLTAFLTSEDGQAAGTCSNAVDDATGDVLIDLGDPDCRFAPLVVRNTAYTRFPYEGVTNTGEDGAGGITCYNNISDVPAQDDDPVLLGVQSYIDLADPDCSNGNDGVDNDGNTLADDDGTGPGDPSPSLPADPQVQCRFLAVSADGGINWNSSSFPPFDPPTVKAPINDPLGVQPGIGLVRCAVNPPLQTLIGYNDWLHLLYDIKVTAGYADGLPGAVPPGDPGHVPPPDSDVDGWHDGHDNCISVVNANQENYDGDALGDACEDEDDGDGYTDAMEAGTPLCNGVNNDPFDAGGMDTAVDDGCPGGPALVGTYSEAEFNTGTSSLGRCEAGGTATPSAHWPADLAAAAGFSEDKINISDLAVFVAPFRRIGTKPGDALFSARYDVVPGTTFGMPWINIVDLSNVAFLAPPMPPYNGTRAFGGAVCTDP